MVAKVIKVFPLDSREYTDRQGQSQVFKSKGFILHDGFSSFYAEAIQGDAESIEALNVPDSAIVSVHMICQAREYKTKNDAVKYANEFTIQRMMLL